MKCQIFKRLKIDTYNWNTVLLITDQLNQEIDPEP